MTSYLSGLLTSTTSKYNNLRRSLLDSEADGDTEDDSHISRVLRAYYVEKGRPFPPWLPPDPKSSSSSSSLRNASSQPSSWRQQQQQQQAPGRRGQGLSDLWDDSPQREQPPPASLRRSDGMRNAALQRPGQGPGPGGPPPGGMQGPRVQPQWQQRRPVPGDRDASYDSRASSSRGSGVPLQETQSNQSAGSAQERLKARLWGSGGSAR